MTKVLNYQDVAEFYKVSSTGYKGTKQIESFGDVPVIFLQGTGFRNQNFQEGVTSDAVCYPDFNHAFIEANANRLEGMYVHIILFGGVSADSWFKIESVAVNRDHLLGNVIDNIECRLKKTTPLPLVS